AVRLEWPSAGASGAPRLAVDPEALAGPGSTARVHLAGLPAGQQIFYRVLFQDLASPKVTSDPATGRFRTQPAGRRTVSFAFSGDEAGQGWGINAGWGGVEMYGGMRGTKPDFFIPSGDPLFHCSPITDQDKLPSR